ncbi:hypothetical protein V493_00091 [Pseudogymnoascus sp. VKM F-4281 (FW-2241)]|nr:hypothetical protein V493_00091 [Pseudogymnoascus sp. VKM F-4281 (FW-2241)]
MPELRDLLNEVRATVTGLKNRDYFTLQQSLDELQRAISDGVKTHVDISVLCRERLKKSAKMLYNESRYMLWRDTTFSMSIDVASLESLLAGIPETDLSSDGWTVPYIEGSEETEVTNSAKVDIPVFANYLRSNLLTGATTQLYSVKVDKKVDERLSAALR